jgi:hypothetical protein
MALGVLDDPKLEHVPGTSPLTQLGREDALAEEGIGLDRGLLKHDPTGQIVLVPQPSDSPNDPYNWPRWKKEMFTVTFAYGCGCVGGKIHLHIARAAGRKNWKESLTKVSSRRPPSHGCNRPASTRFRRPPSTLHSWPPRVLYRFHCGR